MGVRVVDKLDETKWLDFVNSHPYGNIFHTPYMFRVFERTKNYEPIFLAAVDEKTDEVLSLLLSVRIRVSEKLPDRFSSRAVIYGGILHKDDAPDSLKELLKAYDEMAKSKGLFTEVRNLNETSNIRQTLEQQGYKYEEHLNYLIDLQKPPDEIFGSFSENRKRNIKKAIKKGVDVEVITKEKEISIFYEILRETYSRIKVPLPDISLFQAMFDELESQGMLKLLLAKWNNSYICAVTLFVYKKTIFYWYAGTKNNFFSLSPNELLVWYAIKWGAENGYHTFDFGGAGKPNEEYGVREFKKRFGGRLVNYGRYYKLYHPFALKISKIGYSLYRRFL